MPRADALAPRQKFPPPTTIPSSSPESTASLISAAMRWTISGEMLSVEPGSRRASPLSFRTARLKGRGSFLAVCGISVARIMNEFLASSNPEDSIG